jgi:hypothetical protein
MTLYFVLTQINKAPRAPPAIPSIIAAGISAKSDGSLDDPNLTNPAFIIVISDPV